MIIVYIKNSKAHVYVDTPIDGLATFDAEVSHVETRETVHYIYAADKKKIAITLPVIGTMIVQG